MVGAVARAGGQDFAIARPEPDLPPNPAFTFAPATPAVGDVVTFDASPSTAVAGGVSAIAWDLDDEGTYDDATAAMTTASFTTRGGHPVSVRVTDGNGLQATATNVVPVACGNAPSFLSVDCRLAELLATVDG